MAAPIFDGYHKRAHPVDRQQVPRAIDRIAAALARLVCCVALIAIAGCSGDDDPVRQDLPDLSFEPATERVPLTIGEFLDFKVIDRTNPNYEVTWRRPGQPTEAGPRYRYFPHHYGPDTLTALIDYADQSLTRRWLIDIAYPVLEVDFTPAADTLSLIETMSVELGAANNRGNAAAHEWTLDGRSAGSDSTYVYEADTPGAHTLRCRVEVGSDSAEHTWHLDVTDIDEAVMPPVRDLVVTRTLSFGEIKVFWRAIGYWYLPIREYEVRISHDGPITAATVESSTTLGVYSADPEQEFHTEIFVVGDHGGLIPGQDAWFAVVAVDESGTTSLSDTSLPLGIPFYWYIEGTVRDVAGQPLAGIEIQDSAGQHLVLSDTDGSYRLGPLANHLTITLTASLAGDGQQLGWHAVQAEQLTYFGVRRRDFVMIPRYEIPAACGAHRGSFIHYLRYMTTTLQVRSDRPNFELYRWENYPLSVYVPAEGMVGGLDYRTAALAAVDIWNQKLPEPVFTLVDDAASADVSFRFDEVSSNAFGRARLLQPGDGQLNFGSVVPEKAEVLLYEAISSALGAESTALHELGHVLGLINHSPCNTVGYLMYTVASSSTENWPEHAIHANELQAVHQIRHLPQGTDMFEYPVE